MANFTDELKQQIEAAFDYRGHVTVNLKDGTAIEGFVYNREYDNPRACDRCFVDLYLVGSGDSHRVEMGTIASVVLSGTDHAAGKSYQEWMAKQKAAHHSE